MASASIRRPCSEVVGAHGLIIRTGGVVDAALLDAERLKVVGRHGVGYDQIDVEAATPEASRSSTRPVPILRASPSSLCAADRAVAAFSADDGRAGGLQLPRAHQHDRPRDGRQDARHHRLRADRPPRRRDRPLGFGMNVLYHDIVPAPEEVERAGAAGPGCGGPRSLGIRHAARPARYQHARA